MIETLVLWLLSHGPTVSALALVFLLGMIAGAFVQFTSEDSKKAQRQALDGTAEPQHPRY